MDFAKKILNKYGWKEGDGLGKKNDGIVKPLKASLKFDSAGFGADQAASDFNNHWWERVFNEAAQNVQIQADENGTVSMNLKNSDDEVEISTKGYSLKKLKKAKAQNSDERYNNFMQSKTLGCGEDEVKNFCETAVDDIAVKSFKTLTDEELFRACGGRTAHKGARHGLTLNGKLARIEQQEQELLAKMLEKQNLPKVQDDVKLKEKRKKKNQQKEDSSVQEIPSENKNKKSNKESPTVNKIVQEPEVALQEFECVENTKSKKKSKKRKSADREIREQNSTDPSRKRKISHSEEANIEYKEKIAKPMKKNKKKSKKKDE